MSKDLRLGPRPADVTHWRCRRIDESQKGAPLFHGGDDGVETSEWPIKTCSPETIRDWFGPGAYVAQYIRIDSNGQRMPRGRSRVVQIVARTTSEPPVAAPPVALSNAANPVPMSPSPAVISAPPAAAPDSIAHVFSLLAFLQDRDEKARAAAREEARLANERYRADTELVIERERIAMQERVAAMQAAQRSAVRLPANAGNELAELRDELAAMREEVQQVIDGAAEPPSAPPSPAPPPADGLTRLVEILQPMLPLIMSRLTSVPATPPPLPQGSDHAAE